MALWEEGSASEGREGHLVHRGPQNCQCRERRQVSSGRSHSSCCGGLQEWSHTTSHSLIWVADWPHVAEGTGSAFNLEVQPLNVLLKLLHTNSQATPLVIHKPLANGSPVGVLTLPPRATKTIIINLTAPPPMQGKRSLDIVGLPSRILKSLPAICSIRCTRRLVMVVPQNRTVLTLLR